MRLNVAAPSEEEKRGNDKGDHEFWGRKKKPSIHAEKKTD